MSEIKQIELWKSGDRLDSLGHESPKRGSLFRHLAKWYRRSLVPILLREIRSFRHRISIEVKIRRAFSLGFPVVPEALQETLVSGSLTYRRAYSRSMTRLAGDEPYYSTADHILATRMWIEGSNYCACSCHNKTSQEEQGSLKTPVG